MIADGMELFAIRNDPDVFNLFYMDTWTLACPVF
jgi:hypothetical protein